jgi:hypothetical protein
VLLLTRKAQQTNERYHIKEGGVWCAELRFNMFSTLGQKNQDVYVLCDEQVRNDGSPPLHNGVVQANGYAIHLHVTPTLHKILDIVAAN